MGRETSARVLKQSAAPGRIGGVGAGEGTATAGRDADETALLAAAQDGSAAAVEALVRRWWERAHRAAFLITRDAAAAEDIAQEAILAAVQRLARFDARRPFGPWLHRIVVNRSIDHVRARRRRGEVHATAAPELPAPPDGGGSMSDDVAGALAVLDPEDRAVVVLRHLLDHDSQEISRMLGMPPATVRTRLRRALDRLRPLLADREGESR